MRFPWSSSTRRSRHKPLLNVPFVGHEQVVEALDEHLQTVRQGGGVEYVMLEGPAGIGKSELLSEFLLIKCRSSQIYTVRINASDQLLVQECAAHLFMQMQTQSETILGRLYEDTKRVRKALAADWDEAEFRTFLASADWAHLQEVAPVGARLTPDRADALTRLLTLVRDHPWGVGSATILGCLSHRSAAGASGSGWLQQWTELLEALQRRGVMPGAALVLAFDQIDIDGVTAAQWEPFWNDFVSAIDAVSLPIMVLWAGTAANLAPIRRVFDDRRAVSIHPLGVLSEADQQGLLRRLHHALPRERRQVWQDMVNAADGDGLRHPDRLILAAFCLAARAFQEDDAVAVSQALALPESGVWVERLVEASRRELDVDEALFRHVLEVWAFSPPGKTWHMEEFLLLCHPASFGLDPVAGRDKLEMMLGQWVRYGLLRYDVYAEQYKAGHSLIQSALQNWLYPDEKMRREVRVRRYLEAAILTHLKQGHRDMLMALGQALQELVEPRHMSRLEADVIVSYRHLLLTMGKDERQQVATVLEALQSPLALEMIGALLSDEEDQVRSRAVQSLAQLQGVNAFGLLLDALRDKNSDVRWIAAHALSQIEDVATVDALIPLLTDEDKEVCRIAAEGLGQRGDRRAVPHLIAAMRDSYPLLRESAALALGQLADRRALPALQELMQDDSPKVRRSAEAALAQFPVSS